MHTNGSRKIWESSPGTEDELLMNGGLSDVQGELSYEPPHRTFDPSPSPSQLLVLLARWIPIANLENENM